MAAPPGGGRLQHALRLLVQSIHWTYSLFWQLCPQQGVLVWGEGYYNGPIKTRKTVQPMEMSADDASLQRSQQLRELYDSLSAGEAGQTARRPCAALSPEDLTESEWFYLMCVSFSFPPGVGLPGKAFTRRRYVWLTRANEAESKVFSRAILAKSARIQTVVCIPLADGILELGTTEKIEEDVAIIQHAKSFFADHYPDPALSEHSTSNPEDQPIFNSYPLSSLMQQPVITQPNGSNQEEEVDDDDDDEEDEDEENDDNDDEVVETGPGLDVETRCYNVGVSVPLIHASMNTSEAVVPAAEPTELMQLEMSESIRFGSPDDCSNNLDSDLQMLAAGNTSSVQSDPQNNSYQAWNFLHENLYDGISQSSGATQMQELSQEDVHYSETVATILQYNLSRCTNSIWYPIHSQQSAFSKWDSDKPLSVWSEGDSQWMLKCILFTVPDLYFKERDESSPKERDSEGGSKFRKGTPQEELSANHVLAERRRREKLNERFIILRSLVPFVTKMDKASILGDTIEYVKQLRKRIQDLESQNRQIESEWQQKSIQSHNPSNSEEQTVQTNSCSNSGRRGLSLADKKRTRVVEDGNGTAKATKAVVAPCTSVQVSIIESDALLELQCPYRDGLLLKIMHKLHELLLEITSIQSSSANGTFVAEIRAKVKEVHGRKTSIVEVKKAIYQIFSQNSL